MAEDQGSWADLLLWRYLKWSIGAAGPTAIKATKPAKRTLISF